jgi:Ca2+-binding RTX toxin-like protein
VTDVIIETSATDRELVKSSSSKYTLGANLEKLTLIDNGIEGNGNNLDNIITGNGLNNIINGAGGNDVIYGLFGNDTLFGGSGNDFLYGDSDGNAGDDIINGGSGNDEIYGGLSGKDILNGGAGHDFFGSQLDNNDIYVFQFGESLLANPDYIDIFGVNGDKIDLLSKTGDAIAKPTSFSRAADIDAFGLDNTDVSKIFLDANGKLAGNQALGLNSAAVVQTFGGISYLIVNDDTAGFQANTDLVIALGINSGLPPLGAISVDSFFI